MFEKILRMPKYSLMINNKVQAIEVDDPSLPLLWVIRDVANLTGTKYGCGIAQCGACTVHLDGVAVRSCSIPISAVGQRRITTVEGLADKDLHPCRRRGYKWMYRNADIAKRAR